VLLIPKFKPLNIDLTEDDPPAEPKRDPRWSPMYKVSRTSWVQMTRDEKEELADKFAPVLAKLRAGRRARHQREEEALLDDLGLTDPVLRQNELMEAMTRYDLEEEVRQEREGEMQDKDEALVLRLLKEKEERDAQKKKEEEEAAEKKRLAEEEERLAEELKKKEEEDAAQTDANLRFLGLASEETDPDKKKREEAQLQGNPRVLLKPCPSLSRPGSSEPVPGCSKDAEPESPTRRQPARRTKRRTLQDVLEGGASLDKQLGIPDIEQDVLDDEVVDKDYEQPSPKKTRIEELNLGHLDDSDDDDDDADLGGAGSDPDLGSETAEEGAADPGSVSKDPLPASTRRQLKESQARCKREANPMVKPVMTYIGECCTKEKDSNTLVIERYVLL